MSFDEYIFMIKHIAASVSMPLSVDLEAGYGKTPAAIAENIKKLSELGISGINIEDSIVEESIRKIVDATVFSIKIKSILAELSKAGVEMFINLRSDVFLLGMPDSLTEAQKRISIYQTTGAHGLFFPCAAKIEDISALAKKSVLPLNVMCMPDLPDFTTLQNAGVKRISMGNFLNKKVYHTLEAEVEAIIKKQNFDNVF